MRRCGIGLILLILCSSGRVLAQDVPPAGPALHGGSRQPIARAVTSPIGFAPAPAGRSGKPRPRALAVPTPENARKWLRTLTAEPHVAGTPADYKTAVFVRDRLREWGWKADLVTYEVLLNYPQRQAVARRSTGRTQGAGARRAPLPTDKDSASSDAFGAFNGYGVSAARPPDRSSMPITRGPKISTALEKMGIE